MRICEQTGLCLVPANGQTVYRIQKSSYGALNPVLREDSATRSEWGRWDVLNHRTIYAASSREGAYLETLGWADLEEPKVKNVRLDDLFDDEGKTSWLDAIDAEWRTQGHMPIGQLPRQWRDERTIYTLQLPRTGWFIRVDHSASIAAVRDTWRAATASAATLTLTDLLSADRELTTKIADLLHSKILDDGSLAHGLVYPSKHGTDHDCWAIWLRSIDDGNPDREPTTVLTSAPIDFNDRDLRAASQALKVRLH